MMAPPFPPGILSTVEPWRGAAVDQAHRAARVYGKADAEG
jgi:hypothetical protein